MRHLAATLVATALLATPATAHTGTPLMRVADGAGYVYAWSASASEVTLSRPGLTIVLRPGNRRHLPRDDCRRTGDASRQLRHRYGDFAARGLPRFRAGRHRRTESQRRL